MLNTPIYLALQWFGTCWAFVFPTFVVGNIVVKNKLNIKWVRAGLLKKSAFYLYMISSVIENKGKI